jgi:hypothetical protein
MPAFTWELMSDWLFAVIRAKAGSRPRAQTEVQIPVSCLKVGSRLFAALSLRARTFVQKHLDRINSSPEG